MLLLNGHTCNQSYVEWWWCPIPKTSLLFCYIQNNHLTSIWQYETRPTKIMHPKHKKEIQIMIPISTLVPTKMRFPFAWHNLILATSDSFFLSWFGLLWSVFFFPIFCVNEVHCIINSTLPQSKIVFNTNLLVRAMGSKLGKVVTKFQKRVWKSNQQKYMEPFIVGTIYTSLCTCL